MQSEVSKVTELIEARNRTAQLRRRLKLTEEFVARCAAAQVPVEPEALERFLAERLAAEDATASTAGATAEAARTEAPSAPSPTVPSTNELAPSAPPSVSGSTSMIPPARGAVSSLDSVRARVAAPRTEEEKEALRVKKRDEFRSRRIVEEARVLDSGLVFSPIVPVASAPRVPVAATSESDEFGLLPDGPAPPAQSETATSPRRRSAGPTRVKFADEVSAESESEPEIDGGGGGGNFAAPVSSLSGPSSSASSASSSPSPSNASSPNASSPNASLASTSSTLGRGAGAPAGASATPLRSITGMTPGYYRRSEDAERVLQEAEQRSREALQLRQVFRAARTGGFGDSNRVSSATATTSSTATTTSTMMRPRDPAAAGRRAAAMAPASAGSRSALESFLNQNSTNPLAIAAVLDRESNVRDHLASLSGRPLRPALSVEDRSPHPSRSESAGSAESEDRPHADTADDLHLSFASTTLGGAEADSNGRGRERDHGASDEDRFSDASLLGSTDLPSPLVGSVVARRTSSSGGSELDLAPDSASSFAFARGVVSPDQEVKLEHAREGESRGERETGGGSVPIPSFFDPPMVEEAVSLSGVRSVEGAGPRRRATMRKSIALATAAALAQTLEQP